MIHLTLSELRQIGDHFLLANTPASLYQSLRTSSFVARMQEEASQETLAGYFQRVSAKARRSEVILGLAYATLVAALTHPEGGPVPSVDRLHWGELFRERAKNEGAVSNILLKPEPKMQDASHEAAKSGIKIARR